ncbi:unnamed protein product [Vitrella brassicaformis CCMP3155]|uniref:Right handed beta helix domain-containing protein n=1 Tax=Vitrella brassicaformis (strain CCMP3155) TaxID=1169540 RepID=A0A0G4H738_VITBC|nr:unnamed protein product [Vitrella brassicaformis CCMP3155]|eukprot:CEM39693.1 unnamed protein product [Vitrella brassicaformis CCMP3155]
MMITAVLLLVLLGKRATVVTAQSPPATNEAGFRALFGTSDFVAPTCASTKTVTNAADSGVGTLREALGMLEAQQPDTEATIRCIRIDSSVTQIVLQSSLIFKGRNVYLFAEDISNPDSFPVVKAPDRAELLIAEGANDFTIAGIRITNKGADRNYDAPRQVILLKPNRQSNIKASVAFYRVSMEECSNPDEGWFSAVRIEKNYASQTDSIDVSFWESAFHGNEGSVLECTSSGSYSPIRRVTLKKTLVYGNRIYDGPDTTIYYAMVNLLQCGAAINDTTFDSNEASEADCGTAPILRLGGLEQSERVVVYESTFQNNHIKAQCGSEEHVIVVSYNVKSVTIEKSIFVGNTRESIGHGRVTSYDGSALKITNIHGHTKRVIHGTAL